MITALGYHAENMQRQVNGESMAYTAHNFIGLIEEAEARKCKLEIEYGNRIAYIDVSSVATICYHKESKLTLIYVKGDNDPYKIYDSELDSKKKAKLKTFITKWMTL